MLNSIAFNNISLPRPDYGNWLYLPVEFLSPQALTGERAMVIREARLFHFAILSSAMYMAWTKFITGRTYSSDCYVQAYAIRSFPWPISHTQAQLKDIEDKAQRLLDIRQDYAGRPLADLYQPMAMPLALQMAHRELDKAVDRAYTPHRFESEEDRVEFLLRLDERIASFMLPDDDEVIGPRYENPVDFGMHAN